MMNNLRSSVLKNNQQEEKSKPQRSKQSIQPGYLLIALCFFHSLKKAPRLTCHLRELAFNSQYVLQACLPIPFSFSCLFADAAQLLSWLLWGRWCGRCQYEILVSFLRQTVLLLFFFSSYQSKELNLTENRQGFLPVILEYGISESQGIAKV